MRNWLARYKQMLEQSFEITYVIDGRWVELNVAGEEHFLTFAQAKEMLINQLEGGVEGLWDQELAELRKVG